MLHQKQDFSPTFSRIKSTHSILAEVRDLYVWLILRPPGFSSSDRPLSQPSACVSPSSSITFTSCSGTLNLCANEAIKWNSRPRRGHVLLQTFLLHINVFQQEELGSSPAASKQLNCREVTEQHTEDTHSVNSIHLLHLKDLGNTLSQSASDMNTVFWQLEEFWLILCICVFACAHLTGLARCSVGNFSAPIRILQYPESKCDDRCGVVCLSYEATGNHIWWPHTVLIGVNTFNK